MKLVILPKNDVVRISNNQKKIKAAIKCTEAEALALAYIAYYSKSSEEFSQTLRRYDSAITKVHLDKLLSRFLFGNLDSEYKKESNKNE